MIRIGVTGGIGCGKTFVTNIMSGMGIPVYDCDANAKRLMADDCQLIASLKDIAGESLYDADGRLDRRQLADLIFRSDDMKRRVEQAVHPAVRRDFESWCRSNAGSDTVVMESAILFESGFQKTVDFVVVVDAPLDMRIDRCINRGATDRQSVVDRINAQMPQQEKLMLADYVIKNDGTADLQGQIDSVLVKCKNNIQ